MQPLPALRIIAANCIALTAVSCMSLQDGLQSFIWELIKECFTDNFTPLFFYSEFLCKISDLKNFCNRKCTYMAHVTINWQGCHEISIMLMIHLCGGLYNWLCHIPVSTNDFFSKSIGSIIILFQLLFLTSAAL